MAEQEKREISPLVQKFIEEQGTKIPDYSGLTKEEIELKKEEIITGMVPAIQRVDAYLKQSNE